jgi:polyphosphate glucokinase
MLASMPAVLGIDIGGSGIKGNLVDPDTGQLMAERFKIATPEPSVPEKVAIVVREMVSHFDYQGPLGCTFPSIVKHGVTMSAANVDPAWIGCDAAKLFAQTTGEEVVVINDADAAGLAEMAFGAGRDRRGVVLLLTFGTGVGSALFVDGRLVPNTEFGHLQFAGHESAEWWVAARVRKEEDLTWRQWGERVDAYLRHVNQLFSPDLFILGGGVSRKFDQWGRFINVEVDVVPALLLNEAGIVGAAMAAAGRA